MYSATVGVESLKPILPHHSAAYDHDAGDCSYHFGYYINWVDSYRDSSVICIQDSADFSYDSSNTRHRTAKVEHLYTAHSNTPSFNETFSRYNVEGRAR